MKKNNRGRVLVSRRTFIVGAAGVVAGCATGPKARYVSPNEKLNVAAVGSGGMGAGDVRGVAGTGQNIVALCDVDWKRAGKTFDALPNAKRYRDYRVMLDEMKDIDAVTVSTPDHMHAPVAMAAMERGLHVRVQKPMSWCVGEARELTELAARKGVVGAMGNQGHSGDGVRKLCEMLWDDAIGDVREVHIWTNRPDDWPQGMTAPMAAQPVRDGLDWNLWLGVAPTRPYNGAYTPSDWRGWWDFGCGALGDMGCHIMDPANWAMQLGAPTTVTCADAAGNTDQAPPHYSVIKYEFPARPFRDPYPSVKWYGRMLPPVTVYWYDGKRMDGKPNLPTRPAGVPENEQLGEGDNGSYFVGEKGVATTGTYGYGTRLLPEANWRDYTQPDPVIPRVPDNDSYYEWVNAIKGGPAIGSRFEYAGPFTETVQLGNVAARADVGRVLEWDEKRMRFKNAPDMNRYLTREYRTGW
jgi:predicted dehydrogenase